MQFEMSVNILGIGYRDGREVLILENNMMLESDDAVAMAKNYEQKAGIHLLRFSWHDGAWYQEGGSADDSI